MNYKLKTNNQRGFTLIEILVVSSLLFTAGVIVVQLFFFSLKGTSKSTILATVKQNGDYALTVMERMIRNSRSIFSCTASSLTTVNPDGRQTTFLCDIGVTPVRIASTSAIGNYYLTSQEVAVSCSSLFNCSELTNNKIGINFTVSQNLSVTPRAEETAQMNFQTTVTLRNY